MPTPTDITHFRTAADLRKWFRANHAKAVELWVGFHKKTQARRASPGPHRWTRRCGVGWIDGIRRALDAHSYTIRFTPRRKGSIWSSVNIARVKVLTAEKRMRPAGMKAFAARLENKSGIYSYEQRRDQLEEPYAALSRRTRRRGRSSRRSRPGTARCLAGGSSAPSRKTTRLSPPEDADRRVRKKGAASMKTIFVLMLIAQAPAPPAGLPPATDWRNGGAAAGYTMEAAGRATDSAGATVTFRAPAQPTGFGATSATMPAERRPAQANHVVGELKADDVSGGASLWLRIDKGTTMLISTTGPTTR